MSEGEQEARIALLQEFGSNARNWYNVLLAWAVVLFAAVQVRSDLSCMGLWGGALMVIFFQVLYAVIRAAVSVKLARSVVSVRLPVHARYQTYLEELDDQVRNKLREESAFWKVGLRLGDSLRWWILWTIASSTSVLPGLMCQLRVLCAR